MDQISRESTDPASVRYRCLELADLLEELICDVESGNFDPTDADSPEQQVSGSVATEWGERLAPSRTVTFLPVAPVTVADAGQVPNSC